MVRKLALATLLLTGFGVNAASASTILDLTTAGAGAVGTGAIGGTFGIKQVPDQSTGTGVIDSFLRVHAQGNNNAEQGYNTSLGTPFDDVGGVFTRALLLSEVPVLTIGGVGYRQFLLDINQVNSDALLSLNQIQIFQSTGDRIDGALTVPASAGTAPILGFAGTGWTEAFRLNNATPNYEIVLNYGLNPGSGSGDMYLYVADSLFAAGIPNVILYSQFGLPPGGNDTNDGFEEWAVRRLTAPPCVNCVPTQLLETVPEPGSMILLGSGLAFAALRLGRRRKSSQQ